MDSSPVVQGVYPSHRCKTIHLVRHAQGYHNVAIENHHGAFTSTDYFDAQLTPLGWEQVDTLRKHVHATGLSKRVELVVVSPLSRTMQTGVGVFGGEGCVDGTDVPPLMVANADRPAISSLNSPPFVAVELCREILGVNCWNKRRSIREYKSVFPAIDFSKIETDEDTWWTVDVRETDEAVAARGLEFLNWLWTREEKEIAVVSHWAFLFKTLASFGGDCHPSVKSEVTKSFKNCELRSVVIVDKSNIVSDSSTTDFAGIMPEGSDAPSD